MKEDDGKIATSSAFAVGRSESSLPSGRIPEFVELHQSPVGNRCTSAYLRLGIRVSREFVGEGVVPEGPAPAWAYSEMIDSASREMGAASEDAWSRRVETRLQKRSCSATVAEGRERGCEDMGNRCCTAD